MCETESWSLPHFLPSPLLPRIMVLRSFSFTGRLLDKIKEKNTLNKLGSLKRRKELNLSLLRWHCLQNNLRLSFGNTRNLTRNYNKWLACKSRWHNILVAFYSHVKLSLYNLLPPGTKLSVQRYFMIISHRPQYCFAIPDGRRF